MKKLIPNMFLLMGLLFYSMGNYGIIISSNEHMFFSVILLAIGIMLISMAFGKEAKK